jgi:hypothetical protein
MMGAIEAPSAQVGFRKAPMAHKPCGGYPLSCMIRGGMATRATPAGIPMPTLKQVQTARQTFQLREPRNLFYRVAIELIALARKGVTNVSVAEALAVLLQTWNASFYRFRGKFSEEDFRKVEVLLTDHSAALAEYRERSIATVAPNEEDGLRALFSRFDAVLGHVGAAKSLHLLAPSFFPLWDRAIAKAYHLTLIGDTPSKYVRFMRIAKGQCKVLADQGAPWPDLLKAIDEYNYCTYTLNGESGSGPPSRPEVIP